VDSIDINTKATDCNVPESRQMLAACGEGPAASDTRCIPAGGTALLSNTPDIPGRRALPPARFTRLDATPDLDDKLLEIPRLKVLDLFDPFTERVVLKGVDGPAT